MHFAFLTVPSSGEFNVQMATANELVQCGHTVTFLSGIELKRHVDTLKRSFDDPISGQLVNFICLGDHKSVKDFSPTVRENLTLMRKRPGDIRSLQACIDIGYPGWQDFQFTAMAVSKQIESLSPDMIIVDALSPAMITGVRLTKRKFYLTIPCSPGLTASSNMSSPHAASSNRDGISSVVESAYLRFRDLLYCLQHPSYYQKSKNIKTKFNLKSFGLCRDVSLLPPYWEDENCVGGIHFNVQGLNDCPQQPPEITFVGAGISLPLPRLTEARTETEEWLDESYASGHSVILVNMGSMFVWTEEEFQQMIDAFNIVYAKRQGSVRFLFKVNLKTNLQTPKLDEKDKKHDSQFIRISSWIEDQNAVYQHPALKVFVHHGGGNSFNEAVFFGIPQIIIGQWLDHHEYGFLIERFGMGIRCRKAPKIDSKSISKALLRITGNEWQEMKRNSDLWSIRSRLGGGPKTAARLLIMNTERMSARQSPDGLSTPIIMTGDSEKFF